MGKDTEWVTVKEAADMLGYSANRMYELLVGELEEKVTVKRIGERTRIFVLRADVERLLAERGSAE